MVGKKKFPRYNGKTKRKDTLRGVIMKEEKEREKETEGGRENAAHM